MKTLTEQDVTFELEILPMDEGPEGYFDSGNEASDKETGQWIQNELAHGNEYAWFTAKVTAKWGSFAGTDYLGACSYNSRDDFESDPYFADMKKEALDRLNEKLRGIADAIAPLL